MKPLMCRISLEVRLFHCGAVFSDTNDVTFTDEAAGPDTDIRTPMEKRLRL
jgi:hypothetical protein